jgi:ketosteroid isomerase-like protein
MKSAIALLLFAFSMGVAFAQNQTCSEQSIRTDGAEGKRPPITDDVFFYSGALEKPVVGKDELAKTQDLPVFQRRKNEKGQSEVQKIVVSANGDMAYEYGEGSLAYDDTKTGKHESFGTAYLRVWRVVDGQCKVAAVMYQPEGEGGTRGKP